MVEEKKAKGSKLKEGMNSFTTGLLGELSDHIEEMNKSLDDKLASIKEESKKQLEENQQKIKTMQDAHDKKVTEYETKLNSMSSAMDNKLIESKKVFNDAVTQSKTEIDGKSQGIIVKMENFENEKLGTINTKIETNKQNIDKIVSRCNGMGQTMVDFKLIEPKK